MENKSSPCVLEFNFAGTRACPLSHPFLNLGVIIILSSLLTRYLRYGSGRELLLNLFCFLQGRKYKWVRDPKLAKLVLTSSVSKGRGLEELLSSTAFLPVISMESVNDPVWSRMKFNFLLLRKAIPHLAKLETIAAEVTQQYLSDPSVKQIDSPLLAKFVVEIMQAWLFGIKEEADPRFLEAIHEYRKEIAIKRKGDKTKKEYAVHWIKARIAESPTFHEIFKTSWESEETWSLLLQPFFISPVINITDIAVTLGNVEFQTQFSSAFELILTAEGINNASKSDLEQLITSGILYSHPFPVLERWFPQGLEDGHGNLVVQPNTHVFLPVDEIGKQLAFKPSSATTWLAFGAGKRACGGRDIALVIGSKLFSLLIPSPKFAPSIKHEFSGRNNDMKETLSENIFQMRVAVRTAWNLIFTKANSGTK